MNRDRTTLVAELDRDVELSAAYVALSAGSCAIATFGLLANSVAVIIGAMLIAPLMTPIIALAFAVVSGRIIVLVQAAKLLIVGIGIAVCFSALLATIVGLPTPGSEILARGSPNLLDLGVALAAGAIAGYARVRTNIAESVGGAAIAVALMPPLCVVGIGLSSRNWELAYGASLLFATNLIGIALACAAVFAIGGYATHHARRGLITTAVLVMIIAIPLAFSTARLLEQSRLEAALRRALLNHTQTFKRVQLVSTSVDWLSSPITVDLLVRAQNPVTATQVGFLQSFAEVQIRRPLRLVVDVSQVSEVGTATPAPSPSRPTS
jgi:uncharacterized hydrophobic protein (TIGR00271 family)